MDGEKLSYNRINLKEDVQWVFMETSNGVSDTESIESTSNEVSMSSSVESDIEEDDDATSSSSSTSTSGPLYQLSQLMDHLPIKRGLSNYFQGKSQSFTSLGSVKSLEDLAKKQSPARKRVKTSHKRYSPKAIITKKYCSRSPQGSFLSSVRNRGTFTGTSSGKPSISLAIRKV